MVSDLTRSPNSKEIKISHQDFEEFYHYWLFDLIKGLRLGQAFCNRYNITDNILFYSNNCQAQEYILKYYVV